VVALPVNRGNQQRVDDSNWMYGILTDLTPETTVTLQVRALNKIGPGEPSKPMSGNVYGTASAPLNLEVTGGDESLTSTFSAPEHDGGSPILTYEISYDDGANWDSHVVTGDAPWTVEKTGLTNGVTYDVEVRATNAFGPGTHASGEGLAATAPGAPTLDPPEVTGTTMTLSFYEPDTNGGMPIQSYELTIDGGATWHHFLFIGGGGWFTTTVENLTYGHEYDVRVRAFHARGNGAASNAELVTPITVPDAPADLSATVDGQNVTLTFDAPAFNGGSAITGYEVKVDDGDWGAATVNDSSITLTGQTWGTHVYQVRAINAAGSSAAATTGDVKVVKPGPQTYRSEYYYFEGVLRTRVFFFTDPDALSYEARLDGGDWLPVEIDTNWGDSAFGNVHDPVCGPGGCSSDRTIQVRAITEDGPQNPGNIFTSSFVVLG
jgi:titin